MQPTAYPVNMQSDTSSTALPAPTMAAQAPLPPIGQAPQMQGNPHMNPPMQGGVNGGMQERGREDPSAAMMADMTQAQQSQLQAKLAAMSPEEATAYMAELATSWQNMANDASDDMSRSDRLRQRTPSGRNAGGMYRAAHPLEHIAQVMNNKKRQGEYETAQTTRGEAREGENKVRQGAIDDFIRSRTLRSE